MDYDSSASDHICSSIKFFDSYKKIIPVNVRLPNGHMEMSIYSRNVTFTLGFSAQDVIFMHEINMNLLSIPKLCFDLNSIVIFNNVKCLI